MNRPPDNDFYNSSTENSSFPGQQRPPAAGNQPQPAFPPPQGPVSRPGFPPPNTPQGPVSRPGFPPPNTPQGPVSRPGFPPPNTPQGPVSRPGFPPPNAPQGPMSRPGFPPPNAPQGPMSPPGFPPPNTPMPGNYPQSAAPVAPWGPPPGGPANRPDQLPPQPPKRSLKFILLLATTLIVLTIVVIGGGTLVLMHKGSPVVVPTAAATTSNGVTPTATVPAFNSIGKPVKAGTAWIITLTGAKTSNTSLITPNKLTDTYLELSLSFKNVTRKPIEIVGTSNFTLSDLTNNFYGQSFTDTNIRTLPAGNVNPNQTLNFQIAYEVPRTAANFILFFTYDTTVSGSVISWKFSI